MGPAWLFAALVTTPTAIVDSVLGVESLEPLQLLHPGQRIEVGQAGRVRLAYFASCVHETVRGGELWIGVTASLAEDGDIERVTADCHPARLDAAPGHVPAALVLRSAEATRGAAPPRRLRTRTPLLFTPPTTRVKMTREHPTGRVLFLPVEDPPFDFAAQGLELGADETWSVCVDSKCIHVWVDPDAAHTDGPVLERVIALH